MASVTAPPDVSAEAEKVLDRYAKVFYAQYRDVPTQRQPVVLQGPLPAQLALLATLVAAILDDHEDQPAQSVAEFLVRAKSLLTLNAA